MRAWGQRPLFLLRPGEEALDAALAARGYGSRDRIVILAAPAGGAGGRRPRPARHPRRRAARGDGGDLGGGGIGRRSGSR